MTLLIKEILHIAIVSTDVMNCILSHGRLHTHTTTHTHTATGRYSGRKLNYELYAMSNHYGSLSFGHYTTVAKHYATNEWYYYSDSV